MTPTPIGGRVDQVTRRSNADALQGHRAIIDLTYPGVAQAYIDVGLTTATGPAGCVYMEPAAIGGDGYPTSAVCRLDNYNLRIVVPYAALTPNLHGP